ncbi:hypothetical protein E6C50_08675 [Flavobacterium supellecticarium]|uniref:PD-(D/E)XK nuclease superfamily protein n=1 Tax=Flavobacterium supellecticarium TaxID=2565924 RepID=A0A4V6RWV1_9FLAO|nr:PD-(D/E)XK nuclease domain-containing protein [Flavobacterium supellecticarium]THF51820.1 hypothetical protein E6C50_08675 [Flavobacterium supellecticarium]
MNDQELINIYETTYKEEFDKHFQIANTFYDNARDKKYAIEMGLGIIGFLFAFRNSSELEKKIMKNYDHCYKLGCTVVDTIRVIPSLIEQNKVRVDEWNTNHKNDISIKFKKILGIPYGIRQINIKRNMRTGSPFESLTTEKGIAKELARQRAIVDLIAQLKLKYIEIDGSSEINGNNLLPIKFEKLTNLKKALSVNDLNKFFKLIQSVFASMSYGMKITEGYFHSHIHLLLTLLDFKIESELETNIGRIDSVIETDNYIHIIEFKQNDSSIAIEQIKQKKYYQKYFTTKKKIILVGVGVDKNERNILNWQMQSYK